MGMSKYCENMTNQTGQKDDEESGDEWICMQADLKTIEALSQEAQERGLSIEEYFERSCERHEERRTTR